MRTVFVFILDYIADFHNDNSSFHIIQENSLEQKCNPVISDVIWQEVSKNIKELGIQFQHRKIINYVNKKGEIKTKTHDVNNDYNRRIALENKSKIEDKFNSNNYHQNASLTTQTTIENFPAKLPSFVAIFETVLNVTAQICGGVLLTQNWVLSAASCVDILTNLSARHTSSKSYHTIIANTSNPLADGSVHNVSDIILHSKGIKSYPPLLALMRINPGLGTNPLRLFNDNNTIGLDVTVYGWSVYKYPNGTEVMRDARFKAKTYKCNHNHIFINTTVLCLEPQSRKKLTAAQVNSGGPVLALHENKVYLLGITLIEQRNAFVITVNNCIEWIKHIVH